MSAPRPSTLALFAALAGLAGAAAACGTIAEGNGGAENRPSRGITPYEPLAPPELAEDEELPEGDPRAEWPFGAFDEERSLDEPHVIVRDGTLILYAASCEDLDGACEIVRASAPAAGLFAGTATFDAPRTVLPAPTWADGRVTAPSVLGGPGAYTMWFVGGLEAPALGRATSSDGLEWTADPAPIFEPPSGQTLTSAAVVRAGGAYLLYYATRGLGPSLDEDEPEVDVERSFGISRAQSADGIDWSATGVVLDLGVGCVAEDGREARCWDEAFVGAPGPRVSTSPTGRERVDLWFAGARTTNTGIGFSGSYDGLTFARYELNPVLNASGPESAPFVFEVDGVLRMFYADERDDRLAIAAAVHRAP